MTHLLLTAEQQAYVDEIDAQIRAIPHALSSRRDYDATVKALREYGSVVAAVSAAAHAVSGSKTPVIGRLAA